MNKKIKYYVDFIKGAELFAEIANMFSIITEKKPKRFIPKGRGWTNRKKIAYAEKHLAHYWEQDKILAKICRNISFLCRDLDRIQKTIQTSILG